MSEPYLVQPVSEPVRGRACPPGSKSLTNRAMIVAALADGASQLDNALDSQDTQVMVESLRRLGIDVRHDASQKRVAVQGCAGRVPAKKAELWLENSGTSIRFLTALCALGHGTYHLDGNKRMRERPIGDLIEALRELGVDARCDLDNGCPPVTVRSEGLPGGTTHICGSVSSQFLSGLLMAAPCASGRLTIRIRGELVSQPYVDMTQGVMARFGVTVERPAEDCYVVHPQTYSPTDYLVEPDASAASYFFAAAAITGGEVRVEGLSYHSLQGDIGFVEVLEQMGCRVDWGADYTTVQGGPLHGIDVDMNAISDTVQTLVAVALFADGPTRIRNVAHIRHKETNRIEAVLTELSRLGVKAEEHEDGLTVYPGPIRPATIETYDDHRMAMSFALIGLKVPGIRIANPECTSKTYPEFFRDLEALCGTSS
ncbi:MAG: 3-phosphoshikimate 1-carboxyvinyltransferase [Planctomycetes bacterium]|nr:3-phosphoshikimate 1-carboxyvinyltransferase [Planctomycetota bacterium]